MSQVWGWGCLVLWWSGLLLILGLGGCGKVSFDTVKEDFRHMPSDLWQDSKDLVTDPVNGAILLAGGGASGYYSCKEDNRVAHHFEGHHTFSRDFTIGVGAGGNPGTHFALAGSAYLYGLLAEDDETRAVSRSTIEALALTGLLTTGLKLIANNHSPNGESLAWPSGHTSSTVTLATVMNEYYGPLAGVPLYGLSGLVMYERMETGEHWASDVIFGAAIGYTVGKTVASKRKPEIFGMEVMPYFNPESGSSGIVLAKKF